MNEGRAFAISLAESGVDVRYAVDAAAHALVAECDAVLIGADSIGDQRVVNKIGSAGLSQTAAAVGVPVSVLADETTVLPLGFLQMLEDDPWLPSGACWELRSCRP